MHPRELLPKSPSYFFLILVIFTLLNCQQPDEHQQQQFQAFANDLADFLPSQSFQFTLSPSQQQTFIYWPSPDSNALRGMFYITSEDNNGLFVGIEHDGQLKKTFWDKKIGVFRVDYKGVGDMKIITKSQVKNLKIYLSYQFTKSKKTPLSTSIQDITQPKSQISQLNTKFAAVNNLLSGQQQILKSIIKNTILEAQKLQNQIKTKTTRVIIQTFILIISGIISIWMLKRQFKKGYELII